MTKRNHMTICFHCTVQAILPQRPTLPTDQPISLEADHDRPKNGRADYRLKVRLSSQPNEEEHMKAFSAKTVPAKLRTRSGHGSDD